jgi:transcriptional regulator GlxA family with amidase domain
VTRNPTMHSVWFLLFDEFPILDVCGPLQVLSMANEALVSAGLAPFYRTTLLGKEARSYFSSAGVELDAQALPEELSAPVDTVVIPGDASAFNTSRANHLSHWLKACAPKIARLASVRAGAFLLERTGTFAERQGADNWATYDADVIAFPAIKTGEIAIHVKDGANWVSDGITAGIDMSLAMVEADLGHAIATTVANKVILPRKHAVGPFQNSDTRAVWLAGDPEIEDLCAFILKNLNADLSVPVLAKRTNMSLRTFARFFVSKTGLTPGRAIEKLRIQSACNFIKASDRALKWIAYTCGFGSSEMMRRAFIRNLHISPSEFRRRSTVGQEERAIRRR